jgi:hypothetical protein
MCMFFATEETYKFNFSKLIHCYRASKLVGYLMAICSFRKFTVLLLSYKYIQNDSAELRSVLKVKVVLVLLAC